MTAMIPAMRGTITAIIIAATATTLAAPAHADSDSLFVQNLAAAGVPVTGNSLLIGNEGRYVCAAAGFGWSAYVIGLKVQEDHANLTAGQVKTFVNVAMQTYCPNS